MRAEKHAQLRVLTGARRSVLGDRLLGAARRERQLEQVLRRRAQLVELATRRLGLEVLLVHRARHRQHDRERHAERERLLGHEPVGALGERRHDDDDATRVVVAQREQAVAHARADDRDFGVDEVAVAGDGDDDRDAETARAGPAVRAGGEREFDRWGVLGGRRHARG